MNTSYNYADFIGMNIGSSAYPECQGDDLKREYPDYDIKSQLVDINSNSIDNEPTGKPGQSDSDPSPA